MCPAHDLRPRSRSRYRARRRSSRKPIGRLIRTRPDTLAPVPVPEPPPRSARPATMPDPCLRAAFVSRAGPSWDTSSIGREGSTTAVIYHLVRSATSLIDREDRGVGGVRPGGDAHQRLAGARGTSDPPRTTVVDAGFGHGVEVHRVRPGAYTDTTRRARRSHAGAPP